MDKIKNIRYLCANMYQSSKVFDEQINFVAGQCIHLSQKKKYVSRNSIGDGKSLEFYKGHSPVAPGARQAPHNTYSQHIGVLQAPHIANTYAKCSKN